MDRGLLSHVEEVLGLKVISAAPVSGGDIASAYKLRMGDAFWFCKYQKGKRGYEMLEREKEGLEAIGASGCIRTPEILHLSDTGKGGLLIMEYVESRIPTPEDMKGFGRKLARLHAVTAHDFGWKTDNFIGSLPQSNTYRKSWKVFYSRERLMPQLIMARDKGLLSPEEIPDDEDIQRQVEKSFRPGGPGLVHGDLWGGNYLISQNGEPFLIDPSVCFSHPGMDLAMSSLFGGFSPPFYEGYKEVSPLPLPSQAETDLGQLYYLLVHLNLFGSSYASSVRGILRRYF